MKVISINAGQPRTVEWKNRTITTSIFKSAVSGPVQIGLNGLEIDTQSDLTVHGGPFKAVYAYPSEHYIYWEKELPHFTFEWGTFGENLTTSGLNETTVSLGDRFQIGDVELKVVQPRFPCSKLGLRFEDPLMIRKFLQSRYSGFYFQVMKTGSLRSGDEIKEVEKTGGTSIRQFVDLYISKEPDPDEIQTIIQDPHLMGEWKEYFENKLAQVT